MEEGTLEQQLHRVAARFRGATAFVDSIAADVEAQAAEAEETASRLRQRRAAAVRAAAAQREREKQQDLVLEQALARAREIRLSAAGAGKRSDPAERSEGRGAKGQGRVRRRDEREEKERQTARIVVIPPPVRPLLFPDALREAAREYNRASKPFFERLAGVDSKGGSSREVGAAKSRVEFLRALADPAELQRSRRRCLSEISSALLGSDSSEDALFCDTALQALEGEKENVRDKARHALLSFARWRRARLALSKCEALLLAGVKPAGGEEEEEEEEEEEKATAAAAAAAAAAALVLPAPSNSQRDRFLRNLPRKEEGQDEEEEEGEEGKRAPSWDCPLDSALRAFVARSQRRLDAAADEARKAMPRAAAKAERERKEGKARDALHAVCRRLESSTSSSSALSREDWAEVVSAADKLRLERRDQVYGAVAGEALPGLLRGVARELDGTTSGSQLPLPALRALRALHAAFATDGRKLGSVVCGDTR